jgi:hypothetical protein
MRKVLYVYIVLLIFTKISVLGQNRNASTVYSEDSQMKSNKKVNESNLTGSGTGYPDKTYFSKYYRPKNMTGSFKLGYAMPMGLLAEAPSLDKAIDASYIGQDGFGMNPGYMFSLEGYGNLNKDSKYFWIKIPLGFTAILGHKPDWSSINSNAEFKPLSILGLGSGLMLNASYKDILALTFYYKVNMMILLSEPIFTLNDGSRSYVMEIYDSGSDPFNYYTVIGGEVQFTYNWSIFAEVTNSTIKSTYRLSYNDWFGGGNTIFNAGIPYKTITIGLAYVFNKKSN